jgi:hypothetical protein
MRWCVDCLLWFLTQVTYIQCVTTNCINENEKFITGTQPILCQQLIHDHYDHIDELHKKVSQLRDKGTGLQNQ